MWAQTSVHRRRVTVAADAVTTAAKIGDVMVATSWGKDSVALCHLVLSVLGPVPLVHLSSPYELPGGDHVVQYFAARAEVVTLPCRTLTDTIEWLRTIGLDHHRVDHSRTAITRKADAMRAWGAEHGRTVQLLGLRADEASHRRMRTARFGLVHTRRDGITIGTPIARWSVDDVWAYHAAHGLPHHALYEHETHGQTHRTLRNAGWLTTIGAERGRIAWLHAHYPEQYRLLSAEWPDVRLLT